MRKIALGLFIAMMLVLVSIPGCAAAFNEYPTNAISIIIRNDAPTSALVFVEDDLGNVIRSRFVGPLEIVRINIDRTDVHDGVLVFLAKTANGFYKSDQWSVSVFNQFDMRIDPYIQFTSVIGGHERQV